MTVFSPDGCCDTPEIVATHLIGNSGGQTIAAAAEAFVNFSGGNQLNFTTTENGQYIIVMLSLTRSNTQAAGSGRYEVWIDGAWVGTTQGAIIVTADAEQATYSGYQRLAISSAGAHYVQIRGFATTGDESLTTPAQLIVLGAE